jgi:uncharacterized coiled-coil DUF342 family protein
MDEGSREPACGQSAAKEKKSRSTVGKQEYISRVKGKLHAWTSEFEKVETRAYEINLDEDCRDEIEKLDRRLSEGCEKLRDLMETTDDSWDGIRKEADALMEDILALFDRVRECSRGEHVSW